MLTSLCMVSWRFMVRGVALPCTYSFTSPTTWYVSNDCAWAVSSVQTANSAQAIYFDSPQVCRSFRFG